MDEENSPPDLNAGFTLGTWTVLPNQNRIEGPDGADHLEPKVMEVLCQLARNQGEVVSRRQLMETVWRDTVVGDEVLSRSISVLRGHLGDDRKNPRYIATVPKAGYRLIETVSPLVPDPPDEPVAAPETPANKRKWPPYAVIALLVILLAASPWLFTERAPPPKLDPRSPTLFADLSDWFELIIRGDIAPEAVTDIAVLPFDDLSEEPGNAFLGDGLTDELISSLGQVEGLKVVARSSSLGFRNRHEDVREIGDILQVQAVVEGTVKRSGDRIRISARLSSTRDGYVLWSRIFERDLQDLLTLQAEISGEIVASLRQELGLTALQAPASIPPVADTDAYQLYLNGRFLWKLRGESPLRRSIALFEQALVLDPDFTRAHLALANSLILLPYYSTQDEEEAFTAALDILEGVAAQTPTEAGEAEAIRGFIAFRRWQWQLAEQQFHKALLLNPNNPNLYVWYSQLLSAVGRNSDALKTAQQARDLDEVSPVVNHRLAIAWLWNGDNVRAAEQFAEGAALGFVNLRSPAYLIFLLRLQRYEEARRVIHTLYQGSGVDPAWMMDNIAAISAGDPDDDLVEEAQAAVARGEVLPRLRLGLWLYLQQPEKAYDTILALSGQKKHIDMELLFAQEAAAFRDSGEFSDLVEDTGLEAFWENWRGPDPD
jgi:TolB-like protein/DNA-binding winged helix-turn-helix (wHTH) protein/tetratricopeptide (TPR) repeat protein